MVDFESGRPLGKLGRETADFKVEPSKSWFGGPQRGDRVAPDRGRSHDGSEINGSPRVDLRGRGGRRCERCAQGSDSLSRVVINDAWLKGRRHEPVRVVDSRPIRVTHP